VITANQLQYSYDLDSATWATGNGSKLPRGLHLLWWCSRWRVTGKSDCLLGRQMAGAERYGSKWNGLILRRKYKDFLEIRRRIDEFIGMGLPAERVGGDQQTNHVRFKNGAQWTLAAIQQSQQLDDFIGMSFSEISIDECGTFPFFTAMVNRLKGSLRSSAGIPCRMFGTGNPGGPGHSQVKGYFRLGTEYNQPPTVPFEVNGETRVFIPAKLVDNPMLDKRDPNYRKRMYSITDPMLRAAWLDGNWDVYIGQAFNFSRELGHIIDPIWPIPEGVPLFMSFDWGFGAPFSVGWWYNLDTTDGAIILSKYTGGGSGSRVWVAVNKFLASSSFQTCY